MKLFMIFTALMMTSFSAGAIEMGDTIMVPTNQIQCRNHINRICSYCYDQYGTTVTITGHLDGFSGFASRVQPFGSCHAVNRAKTGQSEVAAKVTALKSRTVGDRVIQTIDLKIDFSQGSGQQFGTTYVLRGTRTL